ncbi:MAG: helicase with zn-finger motif [Crocinitomicaceae bacterium]|nr:helicase with zn-finger motif [Crocinitomicaceae bacterium]
MKKTNFILLAGAVLLFTALSSCKKCHDCHYDKDGQEIELGEYCDEDEIHDLESNGYTADSITYEVHCHAH